MCVERCGSDGDAVGHTGLPIPQLCRTTALKHCRTTVLKPGRTALLKPGRTALLNPRHISTPEGAGFGLPVVTRIAAAHARELESIEGIDRNAKFVPTGVSSPAGYPSRDGGTRVVAVTKTARRHNLRSLTVS